MTDADLIARYDGRVPRYTSYPTAPHFHTGIGAETYAGWLASLPVDAPISLYLHVPFCDRLCLYCGCTTSVVRHERPRRAYAEALMREIGLVADAIGRKAEVSHIHWGGGTPTTLPGDCLSEIMDLIRSRFAVRADAEVAIEIDPTALPTDRLEALARMGVTRASLGVQDFDPAVQEAIGRRQSFEETQTCAQALRAMGITSLNLDLIYGLPHQTVDSLRQTTRRALELEADRVAVFGYAHVPWMKRHQSLIPEDSLPGPAERFAQAAVVRDVLEGEGGFVPVGLDHFARPNDALAWAATTKTLHRSFQGYTTDGAPVLVGLGASAIGCLPQGYVQNDAHTPVYTAAIMQNGLATVRGVALTPDDRLRRAVIESIMCDLAVDLPAPLLDVAAGFERFVADGLVLWDGERLEVTQAGRPFVRNVAALFDRYLMPESTVKRHAHAI